MFIMLWSSSVNRLIAKSNDADGIGKEGWDGYVMRVVEVEPNGFTPKHQHPWPHINYIIEGSGTLLIGDTLHPLKAGGYAFVPGNTLHQFSNAGDVTFKFICIVPEEGHK